MTKQRTTLECFGCKSFFLIKAGKEHCSFQHGPQAHTHISKMYIQRILFRHEFDCLKQFTQMQISSSLSKNVSKCITKTCTGQFYMVKNFIWKNLLKLYYFLVKKSIYEVVEKTTVSEHQILRHSSKEKHLQKRCIGLNLISLSL